MMWTRDEGPKTKRPKTHPNPPEGRELDMLLRGEYKCSNGAKKYQ